MSTAGDPRGVTLGITLGDPRGIGPEIVGKALRDSRVEALGAFWQVIGPSGTGVPVDVDLGPWQPSGDAQADLATGGRLAGLAVERATAMAQRGTIDGMVTAPLDKAALKAGGYDYPGHTEMLAALTGVPTTMMLASDRLRVVLATTHIALRDVPVSLTAAAIRQAAQATEAGLRADLGIPVPRIVLCALNPHAGDHGRFGDEDDTLLAPLARELGLHGPLPADTVFVRALRGEFDAVIAPYHDVGMTAIKVASFGSAVNITLGLPFVRTSPDHGTAIDIAGQGVASAESLIQAMTTAVGLVRRRHTTAG
ncbi:MAG TPA: 4-hydroxythreonine-4-phosphate dehydrogenase [Gemmatimonas aurantiaca]|uniref:4-hydroxythreonine-4-phosphate dehydrogenase n=2 Tax=Gemmatimonas aurantiaca TaxID=173480 RepID=C1A9L0_GEMAT|nr:4-hydroxythreonine-4-phosphate dehydrogenase PdxA [Gemmatimonas aurantiaca]BAH39187.1 4-hydroxythreonine-4-phosphate dehydrogenase [Gemmatimonas aurantiaca T-27]HCT57486.1 4-hydroxythreonine-4-phosphate dehydrogenase [Gemmatimonas aurantiaca]